MVEECKEALILCIGRPLEICALSDVAGAEIGNARERWVCKKGYGGMAALITG